MQGVGLWGWDLKRRVAGIRLTPNSNDTTLETLNPRTLACPSGLPLPRTSCRNLSGFGVESLGLELGFRGFRVLGIQGFGVTPGRLYLLGKSCRNLVLASDRILPPLLVVPSIVGTRACVESSVSGFADSARGFQGSGCSASSCILLPFNPFARNAHE